MALTSTFVRAATPEDDIVWVWLTDCATPRDFTFEMKVDGRVVHTSRFSACFTRRGRNDGKQIDFKLSSRKSRFGEMPKTSLDVNVWEAGGETDGMILGISFMSKDRVWLNALHYAEVERPSITELGHGIVVKTSPVKVSGATGRR